MATVYHRDQPGAPELVYHTGANNIAHFTSMKIILKACLVDGYGAQVAAGWELINEGERFLVLRSGNRSGYVCLTWIAGGVVRVYLAETYAGMTGDVMDGDGLKTGTAANNSLPQALPASYLARDTNTTVWTLVADERTFTLSMMSQDRVGAFELVDALLDYNTSITLHVGEDRAGNFVSAGGAAYAGNGSHLAYGGFNGLEGFTALKNPATGLLNGLGGIAVLTPQLRQVGWPVNVSENSLFNLPSTSLVPIYWVGNGTYGGALRGLAISPELVLKSFASRAAQALGHSGPLMLRQANTPIALGDGHTYFVRLAYRQTSFFLLTDNPEFW